MRLAVLGAGSVGTSVVNLASEYGHEVVALADSSSATIDADGIDVYRPYLVSETASEPLQQITTRPPDQGSGVNWLNIFYAAEWAIFAGFAFYMWYRLARDAWEKEVEDLEDAAAA